MNLNKIIGIVMFSLLLTLGITFLLMYVSANNSEISLRNRAEAQRKKIEVVYDQMWKIISQKAQVTDKYKESFKEIYSGIISGRYEKGDGSLMKWITESNPNFDITLYTSLIQSIEAERNNFTNAQDVMIDIIREHQNLLQKFPSSVFVGSRKPIEYTIISSTKSKAVMDSGVDDDVKVF